MGIPTIEDFWNITPKHFNKYVRAYKRRQSDNLKLRDLTNHQLGIYVRSAFNDVFNGKKTFPKEPVMIDLDIFQLEEEKPKKRKLTEAEAEEFMKNFKNQKGNR